MELEILAIVRPGAVVASIAVMALVDHVPVGECVRARFEMISLNVPRRILHQQVSHVNTANVDHGIVT